MLHHRSALYSRVSQDQATKEDDSKKIGAAGGLSPSAHESSIPIPAATPQVNGNSAQPVKSAEPEEDDDQSDLPIWLRKSVVNKSPKSSPVQEENVFQRRELNKGPLPHWLETDLDAKAMHNNKDRPSYETPAAHLERHSLDDPLARRRAHSPRERGHNNAGDNDWLLSSAGESRAATAADEAELPSTSSVDLLP
eukprot:TRINITY_DN20066_c0_g1_i1.p1 TRINITY_DN20066_c0_g1~~TRINITY_DN20066_c0_g1_i1.p1  ORF type:complete len:195 (-),score=28.56 TRINITY_DN20066_c0_g1_i1:390-974(-)